MHPIDSTHPLGPAAITIASTAALMPASTWHVLPCSWQPAPSHGRPDRFHLTAQARPHAALQLHPHTTGSPEAALSL